MITTGKCSPSCNSKSFFTSTLSFSSPKTQLASAFFRRASPPSSLLAAIFTNTFIASPIQQTRHAILSFRGAHGRRSGRSRVSAQKKRLNGGAQVIGMDDSDDDDEELNLGGSDDELGGDDDEDEFVPFGKMKKWLERKPRGFGEGKEYDISIEEKLLEEMEKSKQAQAESLAKLSGDPEKLNAKQENKNKNKNKALEVAPAGVRVRVLNLPKKKNIHRDLSSAFKLVPGLISINPAVSGNKKTKDPICKGFAFVHFKSEQDATRFVEMFSSQSVTFGKVQKQIKCELVDSQPPNLNQERSKDNRTAPRLTVIGLEGDQKADSDMDDSSLDAMEESVADEYDGSDVELVGAELEDAMEESVADEYDGSDVELVGAELEDAIEQSADNHTPSQLTVSAMEGDEEYDSDLDDSSLDTWEETVLDEYDGSDVEIVGSVLEDAIENLESTSESGLNCGDRERDSMELRTASESFIAHSSSSKQLLVKSKEDKVPRQKPDMKRKVERSPKKKLTVKQKAVQVPKLTIGGSSKRLKVKEKAVLSDVFTKYGAKAGLASKEDS